MDAPLYSYRSLTSTQDMARKLVGSGVHRAVIVADIQTKGRGRFAREWFSSKGGLWMTILLKPEKCDNLQYLTFAASMAVVSSIRKLTCIDAKIKWPNDIHYKGKKLCGILTESVLGKLNHVAVGIGLNANQDDFPAEIRTIASSLRNISGKSVDIMELRKSILEEFFRLYDSYYANDRLEALLDIWKGHCDTIGRKISVMTGKGTLEGTAAGIDDECRLLLKDKEGKMIKLVEGDITLKS